MHHVNALFLLWIIGATALFDAAFLRHAYAAPLRIEAQELAQKLDNYTIIDAREAQIYNQGHIKGAVNFPVSLSYERKDVDGTIIGPLRVQGILRQLGIDIDTPVVVYDDGALVDAARLFWVMEVYGLKQVKVLNAGFDYWLSKAYPVSLEAPEIKPSSYVPAINHKRLATKFATQIASRNPNQVIIDARPEPAYQGKKSSAKRFGHIPTAINIPASHNIQVQDNLSSMQPIEYLKEIYADIPKDKKIVAYCAISRISAANYLALRELDYDVALYDASWREWGNDPSLPIVNPSAGN